MLQGERVRLRAARREDLVLLCQFNNDVEVELGSGGDPPYPQSLERLQADFDSNLGDGRRNGMSWVVEADVDDGAEGKVIGHCALFNVDDVAHTAELGIVIGDKAYWGRGYGSDAVNVLLDYAFRLRNLRKVYLNVNGNNPRAMRAYAKCGFVEEGRWRKHVWSNGEYVDLVCMGILREEYKKSEP